LKDYIKFGLGALFVGFVLWMGAHALGVIGSVATAPGRVVTKTLETNNIIHNYEWFFDVNAQFESRKGQIKAHSKLLASADAKEKSMLNIELGAMQQSCRDLATKYNANSQKMNTSVFKSNNLPFTLSTNECEV
jgi:hypothetical protein